MKKKVMVVDDDPRNIFALKAILRSRAFDCIHFGDAAEALSYLEGDGEVDIVLMDMMMPDMDGYEAIPKIKAIEKRRSVPVIAVTAQAMLGDREKCLNAGADDYISKPIDVDKLFEVIKTKLGLNAER